jgi:hypothetical protein
MVVSRIGIDFYVLYMLSIGDVGRHIYSTQLVSMEAEYSQWTTNFAPSAVATGCPSPPGGKIVMWGSCFDSILKHD